MGFLKSILGRDWGEELKRAEGFLSDGDPVRALEIATRARRKVDSDLAPRAAELVARARRGVRDHAIRQADEAEAAGDLADAADWLQSAVEHESNETARADLQQRIRRHEAKLDGLVAPGASPSGESGADEPGAEFEIDRETHYQAIVDRTSNWLKPRYEDRPESFQQAVIDLNEGRATDAVAALELLAAEAPEDPIVRLEIARAKRFLGDSEAAVAHFAAVWEALEREGQAEAGLDASDSESVIELWADSALELERYDDLVERLREIADLERQPRVEICNLYGWALFRAGQREEAEAYFAQVVERSPNAKHVKGSWIEVLLDLGRDEKARSELEALVEAGCRTGCSADQAYPPAFWMLGRLLVEEGVELERARELFVMATNFQSGHLGADHYATLAAYFDTLGDGASAAQCSAESERLRAIGDGAVSRSDTLLRA